MGDPNICIIKPFPLREFLRFYFLSPFGRVESTSALPVRSATPPQDRIPILILPADPISSLLSFLELGMGTPSLLTQLT